MHKKLEVWCKNGGSRGSWGAFDEFLKKMGEDGVKLASPLLFLSFSSDHARPGDLNFFFAKLCYSLLLYIFLSSTL